jgi:hypothetical protein
MNKSKVLSGAIEQWRAERRAQWLRPPSWWNLWALLPLLAVIFWSVRNSRTDFEIANRQQVAVATIDSNEPENHDRYGYIFVANTTQYAGWAYPHDRIDYHLGERIVIHYDPSNPNRNIAATFQEAAMSDLFFVPFCFLAAVGLPFTIYYRRRSLSKRPISSG